MSDREEQWFLMDKRLLFASDDERIAQAWIKNLLELIQGEAIVDEVDDIGGG